MKIAIASDHAGFVYKQPIIDYLKTMNFDVIDFGTTSLDSTDYPNYAFKVSKAVVQKEADFGILICGTGIGMSISANKVVGIRAAACQSSFVAKTSRSHNNANVLCLGSRTNTLKRVLKFTELFLKTEYSKGPRHQQRIDLITEYEEE